MTRGPTNGRIPPHGNLLPVRFGPGHGESIASYCRRLAHANGIGTNQLTRICGSEPWRDDQAMHLLAHRVGIEPNELTALTLVSARAALRRKPSGWRLKSTVWECQRCSSSGIEQALRGYAIQFLCLRCETFLSRPEETGRPTTGTTEELVALQREILDATPARDHEAIANRFVRLKHLIRTLAGTLSCNAANNWGLSEADTSPDAPWRQSRLRDFPLGLPEAPRVVGAALLKTWEQTASTNVSYLQTAALRKIHPSEFRRARVHPKFTNIDPADCMRGRYLPDFEEQSIGERIRHLISHGLHSSHVPEEVRYRSDPFIIDDTVWHWRRHVCGQLRHWLLEIELTGEVIASHRNRHPVPDHIENILGELQKSVHSREAIVGELFSGGTARAVLSQTLKLAEDIACEVTSYADPRVHLSPKALDQLIPSANRQFGPRSIELARAWMWLDEVAGQDAYGYLPMIPPHLMEKFDHSLRPDERLSLREYRIRQQTAVTQAIARVASIASPAALHA